MGSSPMPMPGQGGGAGAPPSAAPPGGGGGGGQPDAGAQGGPPQQAAPEDQRMKLARLLAAWSETAKQMGAANPRLAAAMDKVAQGCQEAQNALVAPPETTPMSQQPQYG